MLGGVERNGGLPGGTSVQLGRPALVPVVRGAGGALRKSVAGVLGGGVLGFLLGAAFWVVLGLQELGLPELSGDAAPRPAPTADRQGDIPGCTSLALDRRRGHTTAEPCLGHVLPLREASAAHLGDRSLP
jgi:hypothetical protein